MNGFLVVVVLAVVVLASGLLVQHLNARSEIKMFGRRLTATPPAWSADKGTGVEQLPSPWATASGVLPRSPMANSQPTPSFSQAGSSPAPVGGAADPRPVAPLTGLQRRRVVLHG